jgi:hypothetical protein
MPGSTHPNIETPTTTNNIGNQTPKTDNSTETQISNPESTSSTSKQQTPKNNNQDDNMYHAESNQNVGAGKKLDENGNVVNTGARKSVEAIGRGVAAYATGGESVGKEDIITKNPIGDKAIGVVADTAEKVPIAGKVLDELGEDGTADAVNDALDTVGKAKNGDIGGTIDSAKKTLSDVDKVKKKYLPRIILGIVIALLPILMVCVVIVAVCGPVLGGFMDVTSAFSNFVDDVSDFFTGDNAIPEETVTTTTSSSTQTLLTTEELVAAIPNYSNIAEPQKSIATAAAMGVASGRPYKFGGKPTAAGLNGIPTTGLDCSGFVQWAIWTGTGKNPGTLSTATIISGIGTKFKEISASELQPGDIGLKHKGSGANHTGIYAGDGMWYNAASSKTGIVKSKYSAFTVYLRYIGD